MNSLGGCHCLIFLASLKITLKVLGNVCGKFAIPATNFLNITIYMEIKIGQSKTIRNKSTEKFDLEYIYMYRTLEY